MFRIIAVFLFIFLKGAAVMEKIIFEPEKKMWEAAAERNKETFLQLVSPEAVMVCGGFRCSGAEYAGFIGDFCIFSFEIQDFETVVETPTPAQAAALLYRFLLRIIPSSASDPVRRPPCARAPAPRATARLPCASRRNRSAVPCWCR